MYLCLNRATAGGGMDLPAFVQLAADAGFDGADADLGWGAKSGADALSQLYGGRNLRFGGWGVPFDWRKQPPAPAEGLATLRQYAKLAAQLKIDSCCTWIMPSSELRFIDNWAFHVERLRPIAQVLGECGLRFGLEFVAPHHLRRMAPHEFVFTPGAMLELAGGVGENVGLLVDSIHCYAAGATWEDVAGIPAEKIVWVHINDAPAGPVDQVRDNQRLLPGDGAIDLPGFLSALKKTGYAGPVSVEVMSESLRALPLAEAAKRACVAARRVLPR